MKAIIILLMIATPCYCKDLKQNKTVTPSKMVSAAYELFTFTPETPKVIIVEKVTVKGRVTIRPIQPIQPIQLLKNNDKNQ